ncbi:MAG: FAD-binding protein [Firmicutes bacterium]|nr:FAD-binding protein [Bacillota bacterium]
MLKILDLVQPESIDEAYKVLTESHKSAVLGGCAFLRMGSKTINTAIDLSKLDLNYIREDNDYIEIGAMATFRDIETHPALKEHFNGVLPKSVNNIIGVQFRNVVTVGASVFSKYGFSDLITALLALDTEVELYKGGRMPLAQFMEESLQKDILTKVFIKKTGRIASYQSLRNSSSDFPILNAAVSKLDNNWLVVVGARPTRAVIATNASEKLSNGEDISNSAKAAAEELSFAGNLRGSAEYRKAMCEVLVKRAATEVMQCR